MVGSGTSYSVSVALISLLAASRPLPVAACASASSLGAPVRVADEEAVIVWDAGSQTEHFIRGATFNTTAHDFGFIVPTPGTPELAEAQEAAFDTWRRVTQPKVIYQPLRGVTLTSLLGGSSTADDSVATTSQSTANGRPATAAVDVMSTQRVADYDAVVLAADNAQVLNRWLRDHGYATRPALTEWLQPYVAAHWKVTAFKIARDVHQPQALSALVRMSFHTERPFFPYREPADQRAPGASQERSLRVFLLSGTRMQGKLNLDKKTALTLEWPGGVTWAKPLQQAEITAAERDAVAHQLALPPGALSQSMWLTSFDDVSSPRPGVADLYFSPAATQETVEPPPIIVTRGDERVKVPVELVVLVFAGMGGIMAMFRKLWQGRVKRS